MANQAGAVAEPCFCGHRKEDHEPEVGGRCLRCACASYRPLHRLEWRDLVRMNVPKEFAPRAASGWEGVTPSARTLLLNYVANFDEMASQGRGLLLHGSPGRGKTATAVLLLKESRRRMRTGLFLRTSELRNAMAQETNFDAGLSVWERCRTVEFFVLDAFGESDFGAPWFNLDRLIDLAQERASYGRPTVVTTDQSIAEFTHRRIDFASKTATYLVPFEVTGPDRRSADREALRQKLFAPPTAETVKRVFPNAVVPERALPASTKTKGGK